jgi:dTMP kinase
MFITLEGPEGSGKTTQFRALTAFLCQEGYPVLATREPGGTPIGDQVRALLFDFQNKDMRPRTEALLLQASRAQLVETVIQPHLSQGGIVLSDRFADASLAYQGYGHQMDLRELKAVIEYATGGLWPDLTLLLDVDVEIGLRRKEKGGEWNRLDAYPVEFHQRVRRGYLELAAAEPGRWEIVDASRPLQEVQEELRQIVLDRLRREKESGS